MVKKNLDKFLVSSRNILKEVMKKIDINGYGLAIIVDEKTRFLGLVTDGDIRRTIINGGSLETPIEEIMNKNATIIKEGYSVTDLINTIGNKPINHLPVLTEDNAVCEILLSSQLQKIKASTSQLFDIKQLQTNKKILVTGGAGYIGSVLTRQLLNKGYSVKVLDKLFINASSIEDLKQNKNFSFIEGDVGNVETIVNAIKDVDAVVHLAEIVGDPACKLNPKRTQQINYFSTSLLATICKHFQVNRFIYTSSCSVYGATTDDSLLHENSVKNPLSLYARMKIESEKTLLNLADGLFSPTILRLATVFGESPRMRFDLVTNIMTAKAFFDGKINVFGGDQWRPLVHVSDVGKAIIAVLEAPIEKVGEEIFNVGSNNNNATIKQIGQIVKEVIPSAELNIQEDQVDKRDYKVDFAKIQAILNFTATVNLKEGINEINLALKEGKYKNYEHDQYHNDKVYIEKTKEDI